jgi:hypothetical protein
MNSQSLIEVLCLQNQYLCTLIEQLTNELMDIGCDLAIDTPPASTTATAHVMLGARSQWLKVEIKRLQIYVHALEVRGRDATAAALGS